MESIFSTLWIDLLVVAVCGLSGGFGLGLLQESGIELPRTRKKTELRNGQEVTVSTYFDMGFLADMLVGALAALIVYALNQPSTALQLIAIGITAGLGGAGILKGYIQSQRNQELAGIAQEALTLAGLQTEAPPPGEVSRGPVREAGGAYPAEAHSLPEQRVEALQQRMDELTRRAR
jgi:hypothetical protein